MPSFPMIRAPGMANRGFGLLSNHRSNNGGGGGQPYYGNMAPLAAAPAADGGAPPSGGGDAGGGVTPFRQSLDLSRYRDASSAAAFAAAAPVPQLLPRPKQTMAYAPYSVAAGEGVVRNGPSANTGHGDGPYAPPTVDGGNRGGITYQTDVSGPVVMGRQLPPPVDTTAAPVAIDRNSGARREAYIARQKATANAQDPFGDGTGQLRRDEDRSLANAAFKQQSDADVAVKRGQAGVYNATAQHGIPSEANARNAAANATNATAAETKALTPGKVDQQGEAVVGQRIQNQGAAYMAPMAPLIAGAEIARKQAETAAIQQKTPAEVKAIESNAGAGKAINDQRGALISEQQKLLNAKMQNMAPASAPATDPGADFDLKQKQYTFFKNNGMQSQADALFPPGAGGASAVPGWAMNLAPGPGIGGAISGAPAAPQPQQGGTLPYYPGQAGGQVGYPSAQLPKSQAKTPYRAGMQTGTGSDGKKYYNDGTGWFPL